jgi:hypothetical protein
MATLNEMVEEISAFAQDLDKRKRVKIFMDMLHDQQIKLFGEYSFGVCESSISYIIWISAELGASNGVVMQETYKSCSNCLIINWQMVRETS